MARRKPRHEEDEDELTGAEFTARIVHEPDPEPYPTGLLDAYGEPLYAANVLDQIGFIRRE